MVNYKLGKIYKIIDNTTNNIYIGSTCEPTLARRLAGHVDDYKVYLKGNNNRSYITSFKVLQNNDYNIILLEHYPCSCKDELHARERFYIIQTDCVNKCIPCRKQKEILKYQADYRKNNKEKLQEYFKQNYEKKIIEITKQKCKKHNCECGGKYTSSHKAEHMKSNRHVKWTKENEYTSDSSDSSDSSDTSDSSDSSDCSSDSDNSDSE
jgi:hypothetical protein